MGTPHMPGGEFEIVTRHDAPLGEPTAAVPPRIQASPANARGVGRPGRRTG